jgi:asparagine synthase (glutamine-hydrolysing)
VTAFAAIVWPSGSAPDRDIEEHASHALSELGEQPACLTRAPGCTLLLSPLHRSDPAGPVQGVSAIAAGQVLLEDRDALSRTLNVDGEHDISIVLAAYDRWRRECTRHLTGEYAFALWNPTRRELLAARDGFGIRLLYAARAPRALIVSNVLAAACFEPSITAEIDEAAMAAFLANGGPLDPVRTIYRNVRLVPAGHTLSVTPDGPTLSRHWDFPRPEIRHGRAQVILEGYRAALTSAVLDRSRDLGTIFLSGGIDSGTLAACISDIGASRSVHAVTATHDRFSTIDELSFARLTAEATRLSLTPVSGDAHAALDGLFDSPSSPEPLDEPALADWRAFLGAACRNGTAALYGEDGDAIFQPPSLPSLRTSESARQIGLAISAYVASHRRLPYLGLRLRERLGIRRPPGVAAPCWLTPHAVRALETGPAALLECEPVPATISDARPDAQRRLGTQISRDLAALCAPETSRQRLELRFPLLDTRVVSYVMSIPPIPWCQHKALPRAAFASRLPESVLRRPKTGVHGFSEAIVDDWRRRWRGDVPALPAPFDGWIDNHHLTHALREGSAMDAMMAWRVFELAAWLERRRVPRRFEVARV